MPKQHAEVIDGHEYVVTTLPPDPRLQPSRTRARTLWSAKPYSEKRAVFREIKARARRRKRRRK